ncbi:MAG TPA: 2-dehydropantoate 2-reductase N-terminal domain-containing protein [Polyangiales bacterium]|nr:2-dehydropantoate 2-reductase N-terminal domain-containing protein [Polyangiales bacterium]
MRFVIVGAGAVGALVGAQLTRAGHAVSFWVRPARRAARARLEIESVKKSGASFEVFTEFLGPGDTAPEADWVFVCVRGEQLDEALQQIAAQLGVGSNLVISAVSFESVLLRARSHGLQGRVLAHHVSFGVHRDPGDSERFLWFPFSAPSIVSAEDEPDNLAPARELASTLDRAGLRSVGMLSARNSMRFMMALSAPFLAAWDVCNFELERLARNSELRRLTAGAMVEGARSQAFTGPSRLLQLLPALFWSCVLRLLPYVIGRNGREVWLYHGPKIREQTRYCLELLLRSPTPAPALRALAQRFEQSDHA